MAEPQWIECQREPDGFCWWEWCPFLNGVERGSRECPQGVDPGIWVWFNRPSSPSPL